MKKVYGLIFMMSMIGLCSCSSEEGCSEDRSRIETLDDYGCDNSQNTAVVLTQNEFALIRNQDDYLAVVKTICQPSINWLEYDMIAGNIVLRDGVSTITPYMRMDCVSNTVHIDIEVVSTSGLDAPSVAFTAIFPKLDNEQDIFVNFGS